MVHQNDSLEVSSISYFIYFWWELSHDLGFATLLFYQEGLSSFHVIVLLHTGSLSVLHPAESGLLLLLCTGISPR